MEERIKGHSKFKVRINREIQGFNWRRPRWMNFIILVKIHPNYIRQQIIPHPNYDKNNPNFKCPDWNWTRVRLIRLRKLRIKPFWINSSLIFGNIQRQSTLTRLGEPETFLVAPFHNRIQNKWRFNNQNKFLRSKHQKEDHKRVFFSKHSLVWRHICKDKNNQNKPLKWTRQTDEYNLIKLLSYLIKPILATLSNKNRHHKNICDSKIKCQNNRRLDWNFSKVLRLSKIMNLHII